MMRLTAMIFAALAGQAAPPNLPAPLQPSGPWLMEYADNSCILSRPYGEKIDHIQVAITVQPTNSVSDIVLLFGNPIKLNANCKATVIIDELTPLTTYSFISGLSKNGQSRIVKIPLNNVDINSVFSASVMRIELDGKSVKRISVRITKDVQAAIERCTDDLLTAWGLDPQIQQKALTRARPLTDQAT